MKKNSPWWLLVLLLVIVSQVLASCDCWSRGGVLVRTISGTAACVQEVGK